MRTREGPAADPQQLGRLARGEEISLGVPLHCYLAIERACYLAPVLPWHHGSLKVRVHDCAPSCKLEILLTAELAVRIA